MFKDENGVCEIALKFWYVSPNLLSGFFSCISVQKNLCLSHERDDAFPDSSVERRSFIMSVYL